MSWKDDYDRAQPYVKRMLNIARGCVPAQWTDGKIIDPLDEEDIGKATDALLISDETVRVACRARFPFESWKWKNAWFDEFTIPVPSSQRDTDRVPQATSGKL